ncbi:hypothetical protein [Marinobacterium stanieri]|uniref:hypothetical protein n=1 Tax=Marinobacterium stanieri TaxID=49186 RepID=UPI003A94DB20
MEVDSCLVPIFIEAAVPKQIKQIGTGIFLDFQSAPFLLTAAHVTDEMGIGRLLVPTINGLSEIEGYHAHIDLLPELTRSDDSVDMAYFRLTSDFARSLCSYFYPLIGKTELLTSSLELGVVSVVGYPASKAKRKASKFTSELAYYRGVAADQEVYDLHDFLYDENIIVHFHNKRAVNPENGKSINPPSPRGVSGGAIFSWPEGHEVSQDWSKPKLVGILHSYKAKEGLFIGTTLLPYFAAIQLGSMKGFGGVT